MPVIAMSQEMGSRGKEVAEVLAEEFKLTLARQEIYEYVADRMAIRKSHVRKIMEGRGGVLDRWGTDLDNVSLYTAEKVYELAAKGNGLIRGWGAAYLLRQVPHILGVRVCAPFDMRVRVVMQRLETDDEEFVREEIRKSDEAHAASLQSRFRATFGDPLLHDLVLNLARLSIAGCVDLVKHALKLPEFQETNESRARLASLTLEAHVRTAIHNNPATSGSQLRVEASDGKITLTGIAASEQEVKDAERAASGVPGVKGVEIRLRTMTRRRFASGEMMRGW